MAEADDALDYPLTRLCFEGAEAELTRTEFCQPAILAVSVACWRALGAPSGSRPRWGRRSQPGGGTRPSSSQVRSRFRDALRLVRLRGRLMQSAVPEGVGTMAAIVGLDDARVRSSAPAAAGEV
jgi:[acyl-carrier-protein] S-malonyltransferase